MKRIKLFIPTTLLLIFCIGFIFAPNDPFTVNMTLRFSKISSEYPLGTNALGQCILSRLLYGGTATVGIVLLGGAIVSILGTFVGLIVAREEKTNHILLDSILNAVTAIPPMAYLIIFIAAWGNGIITMLVAITLSLFLKLIKIIKSRTEIELTKAYVIAAYTSGLSRNEVLFTQILPNIVNDVIRYICLSSADMILAIVGFSYIGLGLGDNIIDWGTIISDSHHYMLTYPTMTLLPVFCVFLATISFHIIGKVMGKGDYND